VSDWPRVASRSWFLERTTGGLAQERKIGILLRPMASIARAVRHLQNGEWEKAHELVQDDESPLACWVHGVVHLQEGDLDNARYWYRRAKRAFPAEGDPQTEVDALCAALK
jgi:Tfp pilus assembly protein PilF